MPATRPRRALASTLALALLLLLILPPSATTAPSPSVAVIFSPSGKAMKIHAFIDRELGMARRTVDLAVFNFTSGRLVESLLEAKRNGARVRVLMDKRTATQIPYSKHKELKRKGIEVRVVKLSGSGPRAAKFHHKYCVIDGATVLTGSYNWTVSADTSNHENLLRIRHKGLARKYLAEFGKVWKNAKMALKVR